MKLAAAEFRLLIEHSPVMIWRAGLDALCNYFNETWLASERGLTGLAAQAAVAIDNADLARKAQKEIAERARAGSAARSQYES